MGGNLMGLKSPVYRMNMRNHEKNYPKPTAEGRPTVGRQAGRKPSGDGQEPHIRPSGWNELAQHNEIPSFSPAGKWGAWVVEIPAPYPGRSVPLASGFRAGSASVSNGGGDGAEVSRGHSSYSEEPGLRDTRLTAKPENSEEAE